MTKRKIINYRIAETCKSCFYYTWRYSKLGDFKGRYCKKHKLKVDSSDICNTWKDRTK